MGSDGSKMAEGYGATLVIVFVNVTLKKLVLVGSTVDLSEVTVVVTRRVLLSDMLGTICSGQS